MWRRYNIALIPSAHSARFVSLAQRFSEIAASYRICDNSLSIPHVTLCHFRAEAGDIKTIWQRLGKSVTQPSIELTFDQISCQTIHEINWIALIPDHLPELMRLHHLAAALVDNLLGTVGKDYDPHLTLINTYHADFKAIAQAMPFTPINDSFVIAVGESDDVGQLTKIIHRY